MVVVIPLVWHVLLILGLIMVNVIVQATKVEDLQKSDYEEEIKRRSKRIFIPNWFTVDLKTGVTYSLFLAVVMLPSVI